MAHGGSPNRPLSALYFPMPISSRWDFHPWSFGYKLNPPNRRMRTRMYGGVTGTVGDHLPMSILSSLPGIPLPLHAGLFSFVPAGTWPRRQYEIVSRLSMVVASRWIDPSASQAQRQNDRGKETFG